MRLGFAEGWRLEPELAPEGPLTLVISAADVATVIDHVAAVLVDEEEPVEYGTPLFKIDPNG